MTGSTPEGRHAPAQDHRVIGPGPIWVRFWADDAVSPSGQNLAVTCLTSGRSFQLTLPQFPEFAAAHAGCVLVGENVAAVHWAVLDALAQNGPAEKLALWSVADQSHWVDLRLLARDVRLAAGRYIERYKDLRSDVLGARYTFTNQAPASSRGVNGSPAAPTDDQIRGDYERLRALAVRLADEADEPREPPYVLNNLTAAEKEKMSRDLASLIAKISSSGVPPDSPSADQSRTSTLRSAETQPGGPERSHHPEGCPGHGAAARAGIVIHGLSVMNGPGLLVSSVRLPAFTDRVRRRFEHASRLLADDRDLQSCFDWNGKGIVALNDKGHPEIDRKRLSKALAKIITGLVDGLNRPAAIPLARRGGPDLNPERWGFWPGCHRGLWAWREVRRTAEILRTFQDGSAIRPAHFLDPSLRSEKPHLQAYRRLNAPVLTPAPGSRFVVVTLRELKARCLAAVCRRRRYASASGGRLFQHLLPLEDLLPEITKEGDVGEKANRAKISMLRDPLEEMTREFFLAAGARIGSPPTPLTVKDLAPSGPDPDPHDLTSCDDFDPRAEEGEDPSIRVNLSNFDVGRELTELKDEHPSDFERCSRLTAAFLEGLPLGLPDSLLKVYLNLEHDLDLTGTELTRLKGIFCRSVACEIRDFLEDRTHFLAARNLGRTANDVIESVSNPDTAGAHARNQIEKKKADPFHTKAVDQIATGPITAELFEYRGNTLGGRPTVKAAQAEVRRAEWLGSADDVVLDVAYNLLRAGHGVVALADDEILLEVTESGSSDDWTSRLVPHVRTPILQGLGLRFEVQVTDVW